MNRNSAIEEMIDGKEIYFCCHGCRGVYHVLRDEGFANFYERRDAWEPGPNESVAVSEELFLEGLKELDGEYEITIMLSGIRCASCVWLVENYLNKQSGITYVRVNYATHKAKIRWVKGGRKLKEILDGISNIGYCPLPITEKSENIFAKERKEYFMRFSVAAFFTMQIMIYSAALYAGYFQGIDSNLKTFFQYIAWALATPVMFYSGYPFIKNSIKAFKNKTLTMDTLVFLGSFSAYSYSVAAVFTGHEVYFDTSSMIIMLILLGRFIETGAKVRTSNAVTKLLSFQPTQVKKFENFDLEKVVQGELVSVSVHIKTVQVGDYLEVLPGGSIPADGTVVFGESEIDESMLTGEALPVNKIAGDRVFAGTANLNGRIIITAEGVGEGTTLSGIVRAVEEAQSEKAPIQNVADKVVGWFVPVIVLTAFCTLFIKMYFGAEFFDGLMNAVSVLVIACPCALGLATPLAILVSGSKIAKSGAVVKSGDTIESLSRIDTFCFDKTGTITKGEFRVNQIETFGISRERLLQIASSAERGSDHLISKAVVKAFDGDFLKVEHFKEHPGKGVEADVDGSKVYVGNKTFISEVCNITEEKNMFSLLSKDGYTTVGICIEGELKGYISLGDSIRDNASAELQKLRNMGCRVMMITGDSVEAAEGVVKKLGVEGLEYIAGVTPFDKAEKVRWLKDQGAKVAMVGDGINDAPALTEADIGIAMGKGTDIAIESADVVLISERLSVIPEIRSTAGRTLGIIKQNLFWAFSYNIIAVPLAVGGYIHPIISAGFMSISSLLVVFNSLRINR